MTKTGKSLEKLVATLERVLADDSAVESIDSPKRLRDRVTGRLREHDVVLTIRNGHHTLLVAIECRDRSRPIGQPEVEAFKQKCDDTGINSALMVSPKGFYKTGRTKAGFYGIRCLDLNEMDSFDWLQIKGLQKFTRKLLDRKWVFFPDKDGIVTSENMEVLSPDGSLFNETLILENSQRILTILLPQGTGPIEQTTIKTRVEANGLILRNTDTKETVGVSWIGVELTYEITEEFLPFQIQQYTEGDQATPISESAIANIEFGDTSGKIMLIKPDNKEIHVVFVSDKKE